MTLPELLDRSPTPGVQGQLTTLSGNGGAIASGAATMNVTGAASSPLQYPGQFHIVVDQEVMLVTAGASGTTWTITRAQENTAAASHNDGAAVYHFVTRDAMFNLVSEALSMIQNGVIQTADLLVGTISITTGTGALTFTPAATGVLPAYVKSTSGLLVPVGYLGGAQTITPATPANTKYAVIGVEIDTTGAITLVKGVDTATQLNTGSLIAANSPATTSGAMRIADFAIWNNGGVFNFSDHTTVASKGVNWIDRRPWARGANTGIVVGTAASFTATATWQNVSTCVVRVECTGVPLEITLAVSSNTAAGLVAVTHSLDGVQQAVVGANVPTVTPANSTFTQSPTATYQVAAPSAGSHLFQLMMQPAPNTPTAFPQNSGIRVKEVMQPTANNGTA